VATKDPFNPAQIAQSFAEKCPCWHVPPREFVHVRRAIEIQGQLHRCCNFRAGSFAVNAVKATWLPASSLGLTGINGRGTSRPGCPRWSRPCVIAVLMLGSSNCAGGQGTMRVADQAPKTIGRSARRDFSAVCRADFVWPANACKFDLFGQVRQKIFVFSRVSVSLFVRRVCG
jgi:hypothetical protein